MAVLLLFTGFSLLIENLLGKAPDIEYALLLGEYVLPLMIPVLCMRSMAEDRRNKTDMFYLSLPMKTSAVVLGKYFALLTVFALPCAVIALYPLVLGLFGTVNFAGGYSSLLFFFLLGASLMAVCQFLSSLTDNLVVAAVLGVLGCLVLYALPILAYLLPDTALVSFIGFLVLAALAVGHYKNLDELNAIVKIKGSAEPDMANHAVYEPLARKYKALYESTKHIMHNEI
jgi:ABC-2 type transport system permease protein